MVLDFNTALILKTLADRVLRQAEMDRERHARADIAECIDKGLPPPPPCRTSSQR